MTALIKIKISTNQKDNWPTFLLEAVLDKEQFCIEVESDQKLCNLCDYLHFSNGKLHFHSSLLGNMNFDFEEIWHYHQRKKYSLTNEPLAKALGIKGIAKPRIWDATCGSGKDSLLIHYFGGVLTSFERNPIIFLLLQDALRRFSLPFNIVFADPSRFNFNHFAQVAPDVIYYDPMYPEKSGSKKSALPRKEMRIFKDLIGEDLDSTIFFDWAKKTALERVVVKRSIQADPLIPNPTASYRGKSTRYDMYKIF